MDRVVIGMVIALGAVATFLILAVINVGLGETIVVTTVDHIPEDSDNVVFKTKYNFPIIPDLHMIVNSTGRAYVGEEGSYCWDGVCRDTIPIVPENTIILDRGEEIEFKIINYKQPEVFDAGIISEDPSLRPGCTTNNATGEIRCGPPEGVEMPEMTKLDSNFKYKVDVPSGFYMISAGGNWLREDGSPESDASYYYRVQVK